MKEKKISPRGFKMKWLHLPKSEGLADWLHYDEEKDAVFCKICIEKNAPKTSFNNTDTGFTGSNKKGIQLSDLKSHSSSRAHCIATGVHTKRHKEYELERTKAEGEKKSIANPLLDAVAAVTLVKGKSDCALTKFAEYATTLHEIVSDTEQKKYPSDTARETQESNSESNRELYSDVNMDPVQSSEFESGDDIKFPYKRIKPDPIQDLYQKMKILRSEDEITKRFVLGLYYVNKNCRDRQVSVNAETGEFVFLKQ
ncbi:hypothetical protein HK103_005486 [Boothiomyces macroporosus]|uniref:TTF-type domain-containing protein n=1 Tax=Boothiomyces macroporosus TaxID=261099 RepID=A0AAD5Y2R7_9FUNG|nr:hypothetical protein HK103_005486 [Boothiomyces macroporosus]